MINRLVRIPARRRARADEHDCTELAEVIDAPVLIGGPVQPERGFVLHSPQGEWESSFRISDRLSVTTSRDILVAMAAGEGPRHAVVTLGYSGWSPGQLEQELMRQRLADRARLRAKCCSTRRWRSAGKPRRHSSASTCPADELCRPRLTRGHAIRAACSASILAPAHRRRGRQPVHRSARALDDRRRCTTTARTGSGSMRCISEWLPDDARRRPAADARRQRAADQPRARALRRAIEQRYGLPVALVDERHTSHEAAQPLRRRRARRQRERRRDAASIDAIAAAVILESWLARCRLRQRTETDRSPPRISPQIAAMSLACAICSRWTASARDASTRCSTAPPRCASLRATARCQPTPGRPHGHEPVLRALDAHAHQLRARRTAARRATSSISTSPAPRPARANRSRHAGHARSDGQPDAFVVRHKRQRHAGAHCAAARARARRSSTPATATTRIRPRACSTCSRSAIARAHSKVSRW